MPSAEHSSQRYELRAEADLLAALDELVIEHIDVDAYRTFVLYREAVLDLRAVEGTLAAARAFTIASQGFAWHVSNSDPDAVIGAICRELVAVTDPDCR